MPDASVTATRGTYAGLFMVTLATLMYEVLLTRIFSVTLAYHYAFMVISVALFGMTVGACIVYLFPARFPRDGVQRHLALSAVLFAVTIVTSFVVQVNLPIPNNLPALTVLVPTYVVTAVPFTLSGVCVSLALTRFPKQVSALYAVDLAGAATGCLLLISILEVTDGPTAVIVVALLAGVGAVCFATGAGSATLRRATLASTVVLALCACTNGILASRQAAVLRLTWVKGERESRPLYERWNSFSRVTVTGDTTFGTYPFGWGLSAALPRGLRIPQLGMSIDAGAFTVITAFNGDPKRLEHLKYDVTNIAHYIRRDAKVLVVGAGGGRDILSALVFGQKSVVAVEINKNVLNALNHRFGDFSGHLDRDPRVTFVNDEARSYIARARDRYDLIQLSLLDTEAATAAGAYVLTENALYTQEAWQLMLERLNPGGVLTVSRWMAMKRPGEMYRVTALASAALKRLGVASPRDHIVIVRAAARLRPTGHGPLDIATVLVSRDPFSDRDLALLQDVTRRLRFAPVLTPRSSPDPAFAMLASGQNLDQITRAFPVNLAPPTDDSPFFFNLLQVQDILNWNRWVQGSEYFHAGAVFILGLLLILVVALTLACVVVPLLLPRRQGALNGAPPLLVYFASIGVGFMMVEISQMQRLIIFLGHPTYGLSVVLFALLVSSGAGSLLTLPRGQSDATAPPGVRLGLLLGALVAFGALTPSVLGAFRDAPTAQRILLAFLILCPIGLPMGMAFPLGMKLASARCEAATPWLWGVNGATSVCASVLAVAVAMSAGISAAFWSGVACYGVAWAAFVWATARSSRLSDHPQRIRAIAISSRTEMP